MLCRVAMPGHATVVAMRRLLWTLVRAALVDRRPGRRARRAAGPGTPACTPRRRAGHRQPRHLARGAAQAIGLSTSHRASRIPQRISPSASPRRRSAAAGAAGRRVLHRDANGAVGSRLTQSVTRWRSRMPSSPRSCSTTASGAGVVGRDHHHGRRRLGARADRHRRDGDARPAPERGARRCRSRRGGRRCARRACARDGGTSTTWSSTMTMRGSVRRPAVISVPATECEPERSVISDL